MTFSCDQRLVDSPFVEYIWQTQSDRASAFLSIAACHWEIIVTKLKGKTTLTIQGPETKATLAFLPEEAEYTGIAFKPGAFMPHFPPINFRDRKDQRLPEATKNSFWLNGSAWQYPRYENAEIFVDMLVREGLLVRDPLVEACITNAEKELSLRSMQRRFLRATGLTQSTYKQIEKARHAITLLRQGVSSLDTVVATGYADQPHMIRSLRHFAGHTPTEILRDGEMR